MIRVHRPPAWSPSWVRFVAEARSVAGLGLLIATTLMLERLAFIARFWEGLGSSGVGDLLAACVHGARFDARVAVLWSAPALAAAVACAFTDAQHASRRMRDMVAAAYIIVTPLLAAVHMGYYAELHLPFGAALFELVYDDTLAILATIIREHDVMSRLGASAAASVAIWVTWRRSGFLGLGRRTADRIAALQGGWRVVVVLLIAVAIAGAARGSFGRRPAMRKWSAITGVRLLDDAVLNPYSALSYAAKDHRRLERSEGLATFLPGGDIAAAARRFFPEVDAGDSDALDLDLDALMARTARGPKGRPPKHVFLIVMESYDLWPLLPAYRPLAIGERLAALADQGLFFDRFLPGGESTMVSLATIVTSLPDAGVYTARQPSSRRAFPTALAAAFGRLGYRTRAYYGGMLSWQQLGDFLHAQGFAEVAGRADTDADPGSWGVDDEHLYALAERDMEADRAAGDDTPTFTLLLTVSYHPPFDLDVDAEGFVFDGVPPGVPVQLSDRLDRQHLGTFWYADQQLGDFVERVTARLPDTLFVITGDHPSRRPPRPNADLYETSAVPLVLYGPDVLDDLRLPPHVLGSDIGSRNGSQIGSHIDIAPTLIELAAPAGFRYASLGRDLLAPAGPAAPVAFGHQRIFRDSALLDVRGPPIVHILPGGTPLEPSEVEALVRRYDDLCALAWWRIVRGSELPGR